MLREAVECGLQLSSILPFFECRKVCHEGGGSGDGANVVAWTANKLASCSVEVYRTSDVVVAAVTATVMRRDAQEAARIAKTI